jgi:hypothetical protein
MVWLVKGKKGVSGEGTGGDTCVKEVTSKTSFQGSCLGDVHHEAFFFVCLPTVFTRAEKPREGV